MNTMNLSVSLPQPNQRGRDHPSECPPQSYQYVTYDVLENDWAGDPQLLKNFIDATKNDEINNNEDNGPAKTNLDNNRYKEGALVWVLLSKGKPKNQNKKAKESSAISNNISSEAWQKKRREKKHIEFITRKNDRQLEAHVRNDEKLAKKIEGNCRPKIDCNLKTGHNMHKNYDVTVRNSKDENPNLDTSDNTFGQCNRSELFLRARVVSDNIDENDDATKGKIEFRKEERRVLVRYSKGSTYHVRASNLIPVIEPSFHKDSNERECNLPPMVIITPETNIYRRVAVIHTTPEDSFMEIGCDYGITVDRIRRSLKDGGNVPKEWNGEAASTLIGEGMERNAIVSCLGIDKSIESIDIASGRYPKCKFVLGDVLDPAEMTTIRAFCERTLVGQAPSVIAIDVNGNREIDGVLQCLQSVINQGWKQQPRLIIVKSRYLYWQLKNVDDSFKK